MGMGIGMLALQCAVELEYRWNVGLQNVRLTSFQCSPLVYARFDTLHALSPPFIYSWFYASALM